MHSQTTRYDVGLCLSNQKTLANDDDAVVAERWRQDGVGAVASKLPLLYKY